MKVTERRDWANRKLLFGIIQLKHLYYSNFSLRICCMGYSGLTIAIFLTGHCIVAPFICFWFLIPSFAFWHFC